MTQSNLTPKLSQVIFLALRYKKSARPTESSGLLPGSLAKFMVMKSLETGPGLGEGSVSNIQKPLVRSSTVRNFKITTETERTRMDTWKELLRAQDLPGSGSALAELNRAVPLVRMRQGEQASPNKRRSGINILNQHWIVPSPGV
jgi:hypothetical protein